MTLSTHNDPEVTNPMTPQCGWKFRNVDLLLMQIFCHDTLFDQTLPERIAFPLAVRWSSLLLQCKLAHCSRIFIGRNLKATFQRLLNFHMNGLFIHFRPNLVLILFDLFGHCVERPVWSCCGRVKMNRTDYASYPEYTSVPQTHKLERVHGTRAAMKRLFTEHRTSAELLAGLFRIFGWYQRW